MFKTGAEIVGYEGEYDGNRTMVHLRCSCGTIETLTLGLYLRRSQTGCQTCLAKAKIKMRLESLFEEFRSRGAVPNFSEEDLEEQWKIHKQLNECCFKYLCPECKNETSKMYGSFLTHPLCSLCMKPVTSKKISESFANKTPQSKEDWKRTLSRSVAETMQMVWNSRTPEERKQFSEAVAKGLASRSPEEKEAWKQAIAEGLASRSPEAKEAWRHAISESMKLAWASKTLEERKHWGEAIAQGLANRSPEAKKAWRQAISDAWTYEMRQVMSKLQKEKWASLSLEEKQKHIEKLVGYKFKIIQVGNLTCMYIDYFIEN